VNFPEFFEASFRKAGFSQASFGRAIKMTGPFVNMLCKGKATPPLDRIDEWAGILNMDAETTRTFKMLAGLTHIPDQKARDLIADELISLRQQVSDLSNQVRGLQR
jgi:transcriptional regulator with XRE-family HTH domain